MLLKRLAVGGMAELFLADDTSTGEKVVIKRILPYLSHEPEFVQMFLDEARIAAQLHHQHIIQVHELGKLQESMFIAMEFVDGVDLRKIFQEETKLGLSVPYGVAAMVTSRICAGLGYAHNATGMDGRRLGVIHRDISPQNVMVGFDGKVKLVDFGIAKATSLMDRSKPGVIKGKFLYLSPEQLSADRIDHRADLFAVGAMLYELTTGKPPFYKPTTEAVIYAIRSEEPPPPTALRSDYPPELARIVMKCLVKDRTKRYQQGDEVHQDLEAFLAANFPTDEAELRGYVQRLFGKEEEESTRLAIEKKPSGRKGPTQEPPGRKASNAAMPAAPPEPISKPPTGPGAASSEPVRASPGLTRKPTITSGKQVADPGEGLRTKLASPGEVARAMSPVSALPMRKPSASHYQGAGSGPAEPSITHETLEDGLPAEPPPTDDDEPEMTLPPSPRIAPAPLQADDDEDEATVPLPVAVKQPKKGTPVPPPRGSKLGIDPPVFDLSGPVPASSAPPVDDPDGDGLTPMSTQAPYREDEEEENSTATVSDSPRAKPKRSGSGSTPGRAPAGADKKSAGALVVAAIVVLMLAAAGVVWWLASSGEERPSSSRPKAAAPVVSPPPTARTEAAAPTEAAEQPAEEAPAEETAAEAEEPSPRAAEASPTRSASALSTQRLTLVFDGPRGATVTRNGQQVPLGVAVEADPGMIEYQYRCPGKRSPLMRGAIQLDASAIGTPVHIPLSNCRR